MISIKDVSFSYDSAVDVISNANVSIDDGEFMLLTGGSGSGKSTFLRMLNGLVPHVSGGRFSGDIEVNGMSVRENPPRKLATQVGFVHQDPESHSLLDNVYQEIAFGLENIGSDSQLVRRRVEESLDALDISHLRNRSISTLSGGEKQRIAIACALAFRPTTLALDEPTSQLDPQAIDHVVDILRRLNSEFGTSIVIAEHHFDKWLFVDSSFELDMGQTPKLVLDLRKSRAYENSEIGKVASAIGSQSHPMNIRDAKRVFSSTDYTVSPITKTQAAGNLVAKLQNATVTKEKRKILRGADLKLYEGEIVAVMGRNGAGKSTMLRVLSSLEKSKSGTIQVEGRVAYAPQDPNAMLFAQTVRRNIYETIDLVGGKDSDADPIVDQLNIRHLLDRHPRDLSLGERQRVSIATVAVGVPQIICTDEPTRGADSDTRAALANFFDNFVNAGGTVVVATHDTEFVARVASRVVLLAEGEIIDDGNVRKLLSDSFFSPVASRIFPGSLVAEELVVQ